jgi:ferredoxin-NADP reductase
MTTLTLLLWICLGIALQLILFLGLALRHHWKAYARIGASAPDEHVIASGNEASGSVPSAWSGFRRMRVVRKVLEDPAGQICSFHLVAEDGRPLPDFRPGQYLTFRLPLANTDGTDAQALVRCYSLSDAPQPSHYRVSIKRVQAPRGLDVPPGRGSNHFHDRVTEGSTVECRAPSGHFFLRADDTPAVLIAGGIGITPMMSMLNWCVAHQPDREVWLFYGVRNAREAAFLPQLEGMAKSHGRLQLRLCFSDPDDGDCPADVVHHQGRVDVALLRNALPLKPYHFYLCGPAPLMESLVPGLEDWGVPAERIHFEAFGPASVKRRCALPNETESLSATAVEPLTVRFERSGKTVQWTPAAGSLLDLAEAHGVAIDSACRAGACGSCQTVVRAGEVFYPQAPDFDPAPGACLMCTSMPKTDLVLEA